MSAWEQPEGDRWEDRPARRADARTLARLSAAARFAERRAPSDGWLERLAGCDRHVGIAAGAPTAGWMVSVWAGETRDGERVGALLEVPAGDWLALDQVEVPAPVRRWALALAAGSS